MILIQTRTAMMQYKEKNRMFGRTSCFLTHSPLFMSNHQNFICRPVSSDTAVQDGVDSFETVLNWRFILLFPDQNSGSG